ncbi:MAG: hypothetical protein M3Y35_01210 [Actinomycetota bacterium]|nr:hypothetical protein [Actinomycetota bacterium]
MRLRSSNTAIRSCDAREPASSNAIAACPAKVEAISNSANENTGRPWSLPAINAPRGRPATISGSAITGPSRTPSLK